MISAKTMFNRTRLAIRLARAANVEGPVWRQGETESRHPLFKLGKLIIPGGPDHKMPDCPVLIPFINGKAVIHQPPGGPHYAITHFGCN